MNDLATRNRLVEKNLGLVHYIAKRFLWASLEYEDLVGEGNLGLLRAAEDYDPDRGATFATYAVPWIRQAIQRAIDDTGDLIRVPVHARPAWRQARAGASVDDLLDAGVGLATAEGVVGVARGPLSLDAPRRDDDDRSLGDLVGEIIDPAEAIGARQQQAQVRSALRRLRAGDAVAVRLVLEDEDCRRLPAARELGVTDKRVGQMIERATVQLGSADQYAASTPMPREWTLDEDRLLLDHQEKPKTHLASMLSRSEEAIRIRLQKLRKSERRPGNQRLGRHRLGAKQPWLIEDDNRLRELLGHSTIRQAAETLCRSEPAVRQRVRILRISTPGQNWRGVGARRSWTAEEDARLRDLAQSHSTRQVADLLGRSRLSVKCRAHELKFEWPWVRSRDHPQTHSTPWDSIPYPGGALACEWRR